MGAVMSIVNKTSRPRTKPRSSVFLCCFGFSRKKKFSDKVSVESDNNILRKKESTGWFSWFRMKNSSVKTVPIDNAEKTALHQSPSKVHSSKSKSKCKFYRHLFTTKSQHTMTKTTSFQEIQTVVEVSSDQSPALKEILEVEETRHQREENVAVDKRKSVDQAVSPKADTCQKRLSFRRKIETIRTGSSQPGSPAEKPRPSRTASKLLHSVSPPAQKREKRVNPSSQTRVNRKKPGQNDNVRVNKLDPVVGMSIIMVTLVIMLIWGRLCAILCTSAWFYFVPRLGTATNRDDAVMKINGDPDFNSEEYKKRVVLEGFLERDHRSPL